MHIPDGLLSAPVWIGADVAAVAAVYASAARAERMFEEKKVALLGVCAAFVFAAQAVNVPIPGGVSAHLVGALLIAALCGPEAAVMVITAVLIVQRLVLQDGGLTALGANLLNMGVMAIPGYWTMRAIYAVSKSRTALVVGGFVGGWLAVVLGATAIGGELMLSDPVRFRAVIPALIGWHLVVGLIEGAGTAAVLAYVVRVRPDLVGLRPAASEVR